MRIPAVGAALALVAGAVTATGAVAGPSVPAPVTAMPRQFVLGAEGNNLWAYDARSGARQLVSEAVDGAAPAGVHAPKGAQRRDINGQICVSPDESHIITGEDTVLGSGSSHDPRIAGWGYLEISGSRLGHIRTKEVGKLAPEAGRGPGYTGDPDNYGCGFLGGKRLFTTAIGDTYPGEPANGQLFLWFGPFTDGFDTVEPTKKKAGFYAGRVAHCTIDNTIATAGGIAVDGNKVYVASNRPDDDNNAGAVWRYSGKWPTSRAQCTKDYLAKHITKKAIVPSLPLPADVRAPTPSAVAISPAHTLYVSSVFSGTVAEYTMKGSWIRDIYPLSPVTPFTGPTTQTPFGVAFTADGTLWIADLGIAVATPAPGQGSVIRVRFDDAGNPTPFGETVQDGLTFPDGVGVYTPGLSMAIRAPRPTH